MREIFHLFLKNGLPPQTFTPRELEEKFLAFNCARVAPMRRISGSLAILVWLTYLALDFFIWRFDFEFNETIKASIAVRLGGSFLLAFFIAPSRSVRFETDENFADKSIIGSCLVMGVCQALLILTAAFPYDFLYCLEGVLVALLFCFGMFHLHTKKTLILLFTLSSLLLTAIWYRWTAFYSGSMMAFVAYSLVGFLFFLMFITILIGNFASIQLENAKRQSFSDQKLLHENNIQLKIEQNLALEARNIAESAARSKSEFLANMSHEIRTPMTAILGFSHLLLNTEISAVQRDYLNKTLSSAELLLGIINDVLDFSKIEEGKLHIEAIQFSLNEVLQNISVVLNGVAAAKGLKLIIEVDQGVPSVFLGDPLRITQILLNICSNGIKFTDKGEVHVRVSLHDENENSTSLMVRVRDTGIGISSQQITQLFQMFTQADGSISRRFGGTGLGLAISKKLVELMDGTIGVKSEVGEGTTFWFTIRFGKEPISEQYFIPNPELAGIRVLIFDDSPDDARALQSLLEKLSIEGDAVHSESAALAALQKAEDNGECYDLILIDAKIIDITGVKLIDRIHQLQLPLPPQPIILSDHEDDHIHSFAKNWGISEILNRPVTLSTLQEFLSHLIGSDTNILTASPPATNDIIDLNQLKGVTILLAEDDKLNREVLQRLLEDKGIIVDIASNGQVAIDKAIGGNFDLILMDMQMPIVDGITATIKIRKSRPDGGPPIIALSANIMPADRERCYGVGMNDFISKPIDINHFWRTITNHLSKC